MPSFLCHTMMLLVLGVLVSSLVQAQQTKEEVLIQIHRSRHPHRRTADMLPKEKNVITNPTCTSQALLDADISGNQFISRAEYVNLLLDLAPPNCPIIDMWLNDEPLQDTFAELSCLCHEFGGIDGENDCCLQAMGVPMLAAFAVPDSYYPEAYAEQVCALIDQVLVQECPSTVAPSTNSDSNPKTSAPSSSPTLSVGLSITTFDTVKPSSMPSLSPTPVVSIEQTEAGDLVEVVIEDGHVTTTVIDEDTPTPNPQEGETTDVNDAAEEDLNIAEDGIEEEDRSWMMMTVMLAMMKMTKSRRIPVR
jgi:hypothetical protein